MFSSLLAATLVGSAMGQLPGGLGDLTNLLPGNNGGVPSVPAVPGGAPTGFDFSAIANLLKNLNGGGSAGAMVDAKGAVSIPDISKFLGNFTLPAGISQDSIKAALGNLNLGSLGFKADQAKDGSTLLSSLAGKFPGLNFLNGKLSANADADVNADVVTPNPFEIGAHLKLLRGKTLQTVNTLVLKANAALDVDTAAIVSAGILQLERANSIQIGADADVKAGLLLVNDAQSKIVGSFKLIGDSLAKIAATAKLQLGDAAAALAAAKADVLAKFDLSEGAQLSIDSAIKLLAGSAITGKGDVSIKAALDLTEVADAQAKLQAAAGQALLKAKSLLLDKLAELKLKVSSAGQNILADVSGKINFDGKIDIQGAADLKATVLKFLHSEAAGKAAFTIDGQTAIDITGNAAAATKTKRNVDEEVWTVTYGATETTLEKKSAAAIATTTMPAKTDKPVGSSASTTTVAVAAVVAALAFMN